MGRKEKEEVNEANIGKLFLTYFYEFLISRKIRKMKELGEDIFLRINLPARCLI